MTHDDVNAIGSRLGPKALSLEHRWLQSVDVVVVVVVVVLVVVGRTLYKAKWDPQSPLTRQGHNLVIKAEVGPVKCVWCWGIVASRASKSLVVVTSVRACEMVITEVWAFAAPLYMLLHVGDFLGVSWKGL